MLVTNAIARIRSSTHDISEEYSAEEIISFLNTAIQQISSLLIAAKFPSLVKEILLHNGDGLPSNFMAAAGIYPLKMTDGIVVITDDSESVRFRYWATPELIDEATQELPYKHDAVNEVIVRLAVMLALNENEYDIGQDSGLLTQLQQAIASGMA